MGNNASKEIHVALAGNPNVGKSTVFNALTGMKQHTGNWAGKTVSNAEGTFTYKNTKFIITDLPGTYSLLAHSAEEAAARDHICFAKPDITVVVCDAACLERNLNLALQAMEISDNVIVCLNLLDEAEKRNIHIDSAALSAYLRVPVIEMCARKKAGLDKLCDEMEKAVREKHIKPYKVKYNPELENAVSEMLPTAKKLAAGKLPEKWTALRLIENSGDFLVTLEENKLIDAKQKKLIESEVEEKLELLRKSGTDTERLKDNIVSCIVLTAEGICTECVSTVKTDNRNTDRKIDRILTGRFTGIPIMLLMLTVILWITVYGANYPSAFLSDCFGKCELWLHDAFKNAGMSDIINDMLTGGVFRVLAWVIAVMLPPMAIFFPLFTLLEDLGVLPRVAFNLDRYFKKAGACGKQGLSMCMSLGCNACGITGARIIDSKRERLIAVITSSFIPCNGKFPTIISIISMFIVGAGMGVFGGALSALIMGAVLSAGVGVTLLSSLLLSKTLLKGEPSSFTLELPPYRTPQVGKIILRSLFDRTLFVLGRAAAVAAPAGLLIWLMANFEINGIAALEYCTRLLDPFARAMGLDGVILFAFILGFPANEIVVPIIVMIYTSNGTLSDVSQLDVLRDILVSNGWTISTAICMLTFSLFHFPCSTSCITVYKETKSIKWTLLSFALPTVTGILLCMIINAAFHIFGI